MSIRRGWLAVLVGAAMVVPAAFAFADAEPYDPARSAVAVVADGHPDRSGSGHPAGELCRPGTPDPAPPTTEFFDGNPLLGPAELPKEPPVDLLVANYQRFGGIDEELFVQDYLLPDGNGYKYPPANGFVLQPDGRPLSEAQTLWPGFRIDRFGFPGGRFLSPLGTPYPQRAIPPGNLSTPDGAPLSNYHVYCVVKPFTVDAGAAAPWFAQPGLATQFFVNADHLPADATPSVRWLITNGYLVEEHATGSPELW